MLLTAHQRLAIKARLPEVVQVWMRDERDIIDLCYVRLELRDGSRVVIYHIGGVDEDGRRISGCRQSRSVGDYSDQHIEERISPGMRARLVAIFGPLRFSERTARRPRRRGPPVGRK